MTECTATSIRDPIGRPEPPESGTPTEIDRRLIESIKVSSWAVPVARRVEDLDPETLAGLARLSWKGTAYLFAEGGGLVLAMAGSTADDRCRAVERLARLPERAYSSREASVLFDRGEVGGHYSEEPGFGTSAAGTPKPKESELDEAAERFRAARFVRPSGERPLDVAAVQRRVRDLPLIRAAVRYAVAANPSDARETLRRLVALALVARRFSRALVRRALAAERPWDTEAERRRTEARGMRLRREIAADREARGWKPMEPILAATLDAERHDRLARAAPAEDPKLRASVERRRRSGRAAYDTARAVYLQRCPGLERKLLHLLRREGATPEDEFVSRHLRLPMEADDPKATLHAALRSLAEAGKVRRVRSAGTGRDFLAATEPLDETGFRRSLNSLIRDHKCGIVNPWAGAGAVEAEGEEDEWERGAKDLENSDVARLAPRRLRSTPAYEQPLPAADLVAEPSAQEEIEAIAEEVS